MRLEDFFTDYDDAITGETNIDPLGLLVIWSVYGQKIFRNRISSISNDVRSYTLNLFHHHVIRELINNDAVVLSPGMSQAYRSKDSLAFKHACLIHLENLFVYAIVENESARWAPKAESTGVFGITKARRRWQDDRSNVVLQFGKEPKHQLLVRQLLLGVSGRYKTPMVEMGFFDRIYSYDLPESQVLWRDVRAFVHGQSPLKQLETHLIGYFKDLLGADCRVPETRFKQVPTPIKSYYAKGFASSGTVGQYAKTYWLSVTQLDQGAAGALLAEIDADLGKNRNSGPRRIFEKSLARLEKTGSNAEALSISHVLTIEPFLADLDLLFTLMLGRQSQTLNDINAEWSKYMRDSRTLPTKAARIKEQTALCDVLSGQGRRRLHALLQLADCDTMEAQIRLLHDYHAKVMTSRGQSTWLGIDDNGKTKVVARRPALPKPAERAPGSWVHHYYIPQFKHLAHGFQGIIE